VDDARYLAWEACYNVRETGGYPTSDGGEIRWQALLRSDNLCRLTPRGIAALEGYGVRTIVDLRTPDEVGQATHPFAEEVAEAPGVTYLHLSLLDTDSAEAREAWRVASSPAEGYCSIMDYSRNQFRAVLQAVAAAPEGGVLVHCHAGKDRTGLVVAVLLALAGVPEEVIAADYAATDRYLQLHYAEELAALDGDPEQRARLAALQVCAPETMLAVLSYLDRQYQGVEGYVAACGVSAAEVEGIRRRLRG
jgi:protein tyrosine/serine phosphatase